MSGLAKIELTLTCETPLRIGGIGADVSLGDVVIAGRVVHSTRDTPAPPTS